MICLQMIRRGSPIQDGAFRDLTDIGLDYTVETSVSQHRILRVELKIETDEKVHTFMTGT
jgi:hypothetical protein